MARTELVLATFDDGKAGAVAVYDNASDALLGVKTWGGATVVFPDQPTKIEHSGTTERDMKSTSLKLSKDRDIAGHVQVRSA